MGSVCIGTSHLKGRLRRACVADSGRLKSSCLPLHLGERRPRLILTSTGEPTHALSPGRSHLCSKRCFCQVLVVAMARHPRARRPAGWRQPGIGREHASWSRGRQGPRCRAHPVAASPCASGGSRPRRSRAGQRPRALRAKIPAQLAASRGETCKRPVFQRPHAPESGRIGIGPPLRAAPPSNIKTSSRPQVQRRGRSSAV